MGRTDRRWWGGEPTRRLGVGNLEDSICRGGGGAGVEAAPVRCLGSVRTVAGPTLPPPSAKFETRPGLEVGALSVGGGGGEGALSVANHELQVEQPATLISAGDRSRGARISVPLFCWENYEAPASSAFLQKPVPYPFPPSTAPFSPPALSLLAWGGGGEGDGGTSPVIVPHLHRVPRKKQMSVELSCSEHGPDMSY